MGLFIWDSEPSKIFVGDTPISKVFLWNTQVRPSWWWGWQPWANTLLYMPMNSVSQEIDQSGNNVPTSNSWVTFWTYQWVDCGYFNRSHIQITTPFVIPGNITILCWCYNTWYYYSSTDWKVFDARNNSSTVLMWYTNNNNMWYFSYNQTNLISGDKSQNEWVLAVVTVDSSWNATIYTKWANSDTSTTDSRTWASFTPTYMNVWNEWNNGADRYFLWGLSNLIVEDKVRTAQEVADYYNQTKWNYWIS